MLKLNLQHIFMARNIVKPYSFLIKAGFSPNIATRVANCQVESIQLRHIEQLCYVLNCEPSDLFSFTPNSKMLVPENHSLNKLIRVNETDNLQQITQLSYKELLKLNQLIDEIQKDTTV